MIEYKLKKGASVDDRMIVHKHTLKRFGLRSDRKNFLLLLRYDQKHVGYYRAIDKIRK